MMDGWMEKRNGTEEKNPCKLVLWRTKKKFFLSKLQYLSID